MSDILESQLQTLLQAADEHPLLDRQHLIAHQQQIKKVLNASPWSLRQWQTNLGLLQPEWYATAYDKAGMRFELNNQLDGVKDEQGLAKQLRLFRQRHQLRFIWRNCLKLFTSQELTHELANMADCCIDAALVWLYQDAVQRLGEPLSQEPSEDRHTPISNETVLPKVQQMVVLGMGKLGGRELNLSSDIDLIFAFPEAGCTHGVRKSIDNQQFFIRLGQSLVRALDQPTAEGFVFRVDMRLRPYGASGALALNFNAMELYYQEQGREWERYAFIKARVIAGDEQAGRELLQMLRPFVYRRYMDFSAIEALRGLKQMIASEVRRRGLDGNIKLGTGGIREVEFIAQAFQLVYGGRDQRLQTTSLMKALACLPEVANWQDGDIDRLQQDYWFLRDVEHALQAVEDKQTQELPTHPYEQNRIADALGFSCWQDLAAHIKACRDNIHLQFSQVIAEEQETLTPKQSSIANLCETLPMVSNGQMPTPGTEWLQVLSAAGFDDAEQVFQHLLSLYQSRAATSMQAIAQKRLAKILPHLLSLSSEQPQASQTLARVLVLVTAVLRRSVYLVLLQENPSTMKLLVTLCAASPWFGEFLARQPSLLDELLDVNSLFGTPSLGELNAELQQRLLRVAEDDTELMMETLRHFKHASSLRIAAQAVTGHLPLMLASDQLTYTAEAVLQQVLSQSWLELSRKFGEPIDEQGAYYDFIIVGYGKVGGWELSYGSDLDLVFIYDAPSDGMTQTIDVNQKSLANSVFFTRLGQRIINYLNTVTAAGQLYEVDMRLRPDGAKGLLVSNIKAFEAYQQTHAWTWEHQALVRARPLVGSETLSQRFWQIRQDILMQPRDRRALCDEVLAMREKMRDNLASKSTLGNTQSDVNAKFKGEVELFHLKQDQGGMIDIEFIVQFAVLAFAHEHPKLVTYTDNIRILDTIEEQGIMPDQDCKTLRDCYRAIRTVEHRQTLQNLSGKVDVKQLQEQRYKVQEIWRKFMRQGKTRI